MSSGLSGWYVGDGQPCTCKTEHAIERIWEQVQDIEPLNKRIHVPTACSGWGRERTHGIQSLCYVGQGKGTI